MAGTITGGRKARDKNIANDPLFYSKIGKKGGHDSTTGGFAAKGHAWAALQGAKGGAKSRRRKKVV